MKHHRDHHATIFVSPDVARPVEDIRRRWDGVMAAQIAAHVTLAYPREAPLAEVLAERLRAVRATVRPFGFGSVGSRTSGARRTAPTSSRTSPSCVR